MKTKGFLGAIIAISLLLSTTANAQQNRVKASSKYITKEVKIKNFDKIKLLGSSTVIFSQSEKPGLKIYGSDNILDLVKCEVSGSTLVISFKNNTNIEFGKEGRLKIMASAPLLNEAVLQGSGDIIMDGKLSCNNLSLTLQGSGDINAGEVTCSGNFAATLQGSGDILVKNKVRANQVALNLMGSGDLTIFNLEAKSAAATLQGSGDLKVQGTNVAGDVAVSLMGSGDLDFTGIKGSNVRAELQGSGDLKVAGTTRQAVLALRNSGDLDAKDLKAEDVDATVNGSGSISCYASGVLKCNITGSGDVSYKGNPTSVQANGKHKPRKM